MVTFHGFDEVGESCIEIAIFGVQLAGLHIQSCLEERRCIDGCGARAGGCEGCAAFGDVAEGMVDSAFEELDFDEDELVIQAFELFEEAVDEGEGVIVGLLLHVECDETDLEVLAEETLTLFYCPVDT